MSLSIHRSLLLLLFALSAAAALIYQIVWVRQATLVFGVSVYAYSAVLSAFMGGSALGSFVLRRWAKPISQFHNLIISQEGKRLRDVRERFDRARRSPQSNDWEIQPLRLYALLQVGIAFFGLLSPFALLALMPLYARLAQALPADSPGVTLVRTLFSILVLVPPTFLMGGTLPALASAFATRSGRVGSDLARLYAADAIGAALGCGLSGLWLLHTLGAQRTTYVAVAVNVLCAIVAWAIGQGDKARRQGEDERGRQGNPKSKIQNPKSFPLLAYALSGFAALGYEIVWACILAVFTLDAVYSFAIMLTTFLLGLCIGGWMGGRWMRRLWIRGQRATLAHLGSVQLAIGVAALFTLLIFAWMPNLSLEAFFAAYSVGAAIAYEFFLGFLALLLPTILIGLVFPIIASLVTQEESEQVGGQIGLASALNTSGAILGSLLVGFGLIPLVGLKVSIVTLAAINLCIGLAAHWLQQNSLSVTRHSPLATRHSIWWLPPAIAAILATLILVLAPPGYYLGFRADPGKQMVYYGEGVETTVAVFDVAEQNFKVSFVNGRIEVPTDKVSMLAFRLLGHLPPLLKPDAQNALMLSFGNGVATGSLDLHKIPHIDAVDLSAEQFEAAEIYWDENHNVLHSPRLSTHVEDGRNFLLQTRQQYDIITTDATHPSNSSSWALFTQEFYRSVAARLTPQGVFMQWSPFHSLLVADYKRILRTFQQVFPHATLWYVGSSHTLLLATPERLDAQGLNQLLATVDQDETLRADLESAALVRSYWILDEDQLRAYTGTGALSTDDNAFFLPHNEETPLIMQGLQVGQ